MAKARVEFNVPESTVIGYRTYQVLYRPKRKTDLFGETDTTRGTISIFKHTDGASLANTFLHESLHAIYKELRLHDRVGDEHEEDIVRTLTDGLCQWFVGNPQTTVWLLKHLGVLNADVSPAVPGGTEQDQRLSASRTVSPFGTVFSIHPDQETGSK